MKHSRLTILIAIAAVLSFATIAGCGKSGKSSKSDIPATSGSGAGGTGGTNTGGGTTPGGGGSTPGGGSSGTGGGNGTGGGGGDIPTDRERQDLFDKINNLRQSSGVHLLSYDLRIEGVATDYAYVCAQNRQYSPNLNGTPENRLRAGGVSFSQCGETGMHYDGMILFINTEVYGELDKTILTNPVFNRVGIGGGEAHYS
ncbi:MAG: hypothetical protein E3J72_09835 [Planctomycetota bacterium]|nr:MAG: hypothetical protein E3J72_09835 [Planctomycetota bacterium]